MERKTFLPLNLQFFAEGGEGQSEQQENNNQEANQQANNAEGTHDNSEEKTFTQDELNSFLAKQKNDTHNKLLKQLGFEDVDKAKESISKLREFEESQQTEQEKQEKAVKDLQSSNGTLSEENGQLKAQLSAMKSGVKGESVEDVVALANRLVDDETDINAAIGKVVEKYPHFAQQVEEQKEEKPYFSKGNHQRQERTAQEKWMDAFK